MTSETIEKARQIVLSDLRSCYTRDGILASRVNFSDYWARDTFWASMGMLETGNPEEIAQVKKSLQLFLNYQRDDGKIPRKIALDFNGLKYLGLKIKRKNPRPIYTSPIPFFYSNDNDLLFVIAFCEYAEYTGDFDFAKKNFENAKKALRFYEKKKLVYSGLIYEIGLANWMDSVFKKGFVLYTNCLWYEAIRKFEILAEKLEIKSKNKNIPLSQETKTRIQNLFWLPKEKYFADNLSKTNKPQRYFDLAGNLLAIIFGIATREQTQTIFEKINETKGNSDLHPINHPLYPPWKINPVTWLFGIQNYHNGISWSWLEAMVVIAKIKAGNFSEAEKDLKSFSRLVIKNGHIHETYFLDGKPFDHALWKSAVPFAWGAGMFLWAAELYKNSK